VHRIQPLQRHEKSLDAIIRRHDGKIIGGLFQLEIV
jgi:hypothetical protein